MSEKKKDELLHDHNNDGVNRRQAMQKVEGSVTFHTAASTAFPNHSRARPTRRGR